MLRERKISLFTTICVNVTVETRKVSEDMTLLRETSKAADVFIEKSHLCE